MLSRLIPGFRAWRERRDAMWEMQEMQLRDEWEISLSDQNPVNLAKVALELKDRAEAARRWDEAVQRYPNLARKSHESLDILLKLERWDEAEAWTLAGQKRFPHDGFYMSGYALTAQVRGDQEEAVRRYANARKKFPGNRRNYLEAAHCLRKLGRMRECEALLDKAVALFANRVEVWLEKARSAVYREDWGEALRLWDYMFEEFSFGGAPVGAAQALSKLGRFDEAEERLTAARRRFPTAAEIFIAHANIASDRGDQDEAVRRWSAMRKWLPLEDHGYRGEINLLRQLQRFDEAEAVAAAAIERFPAHPWPSINHAALAQERGDWAEAAKRWEAIRARWPDCEEAYRRGADALRHLGRDAEASDLQSAAVQGAGH